MNLHQKNVTSAEEISHPFLQRLQKGTHCMHQCAHGQTRWLWSFCKDTYQHKSEVHICFYYSLLSTPMLHRVKRPPFGKWSSKLQKNQGNLSVGAQRAQHAQQEGQQQPVGWAAAAPYHHISVYDTQNPGCFRMFPKLLSQLSTHEHAGIEHTLANGGKTPLSSGSKYLAWLSCRSWTT